MDWTMNDWMWFGLAAVVSFLVIFIPAWLIARKIKRKNDRISFAHAMMLMNAHENILKDDYEKLKNDKWDKKDIDKQAKSFARNPLAYIMRKTHKIPVD